MVIKLGGSNREDLGRLYTETVHYDAARIVWPDQTHSYWANGQQGTPAEIADAIKATKQVRAGEILAWDVEDWPEEDTRRWTPDEVIARRDALAVVGVPASEQRIYLNLDLANNGGYRRTQLGLWLAAWGSGPRLVKGGWKRAEIWLRQVTSSSDAAHRKAYNADLDLNQAPDDVWTVEELQAALNKAMPDWPALVVDNDYGRKVTASVAELQRRRGLNVDGDAGPATLASLTSG